MKAFYVDIMRGARLDLLAGPFPTELIARKYQVAAVEKALQIDPFTQFDDHGVISIHGLRILGALNHLLGVDPADLLH